MTPEQLKLRTKRFALAVLDLVDELPRTRKGNIVAMQLGRAGTSVGANYRAACKGRSRAEFVAKIGTVEEEADESAFWLELVIEGHVMRSPRVKPLLDEANEIVRIMGASRLTAAKKLRSARNGQSAIGNRQ